MFPQFLQGLVFFVNLNKIVKVLTMKLDLTLAFLHASFTQKRG